MLESVFLPRLLFLVRKAEIKRQQQKKTFATALSKYVSYHSVLDFTFSAEIRSSLVYRLSPQEENIAPKRMLR